MGGALFDNNILIHIHGFVLGSCGRRIVHQLLVGRFGLQLSVLHTPLSSLLLVQVIDEILLRSAVPILHDLTPLFVIAVDRVGLPSHGPVLILGAVTCC